VEIRGESRLRQAVIVEKISEHRGQAVGERDFRFHGGSMAVDDFHFSSSVFFPTEDHAPWVVDADGMHAALVARQGSKEVFGRITEVFRGLGFMDGNELVISALLNFAGDFAGKLQMEYIFTFRIPETQDYDSFYLEHFKQRRARNEQTIQPRRRQKLYQGH